MPTGHYGDAHVVCPVLTLLVRSNKANPQLPKASLQYLPTPTTCCFPPTALYPCLAHSLQYDENNTNSSFILQVFNYIKNFRSDLFLCHKETQAVDSHCSSTLRYQQHIAVSTAHCAINSTLRYQQHIVLSTAHCAINITLRYQHHNALSTAHCAINNTLRYQHHIALSTAHCGINSTMRYQQHIAV